MLSLIRRVVVGSCGTSDAGDFIPDHSCQIVHCTLMLALLAGGCAQRSDEEADRAAIERKVIHYVRSINDADLSLAATVWAMAPDTAAVVPFGRFTGWERISQEVYTNFLQRTFTKRRLQQSNVAIRTGGDVAWVTFDWTFEATLRSGDPMASSGWETHVYHRDDDGDWRLVHMHYSGEVTSGPAPAGP